MDGKQLMELIADDRVNLLIGSIRNYGLLLRKHIDRVIKNGSSNEKIYSAFDSRVKDNLASPGDTFGGHALDHLPQGKPSVISQEQYNQLQLQACILAYEIFRLAGFQKQGQPLLVRIGTLTHKLHYS